MDAGRGDQRDGAWVYVAGALVLAICCGGPLLLATFLAGGFGAVLLSQGEVLVGTVVLAAAVALVAVWIWRHRRAILSRRGR